MPRQSRRTASANQKANEAPEQAQVQEPTQEAAEVNAAPENTQEPEVSTVAESAESTVEPQAEQATEGAAQAEVPAQQSAEQATQASEGAAQPQAAQPAEEKKTPEELYAAFQAAVETAVTEADQDTGTPAEIHSAAALKAFRELPNTQKKADAKAWMGQEMVSAMNEDRVPRARTFMEINKLVNEASARRAAAAPSKPAKSPTEQYVESRLALELAWNFLPAPAEMNNDEFSEKYSGLKQEVAPQVQAYQAWLFTAEDQRGDEPEVSDVIKNAAKIAAGKGTRKATRKASTGGGSTGGGPRGDVAKHIAEFLDSVESGTEHPIAAIAKFQSTEYPEGNASAGAISARLFPKGKETNIPGVQPLADSTPKKVRKL